MLACAKVLSGFILALVCQEKTETWNNVQSSVTKYVFVMAGLSLPVGNLDLNINLMRFNRTLKHLTRIILKNLIVCR